MEATVLNGLNAGGQLDHLTRRRLRICIRTLGRRPRVELSTTHKLSAGRRAQRDVSLAITDMMYRPGRSKCAWDFLSHRTLSFDGVPIGLIFFLSAAAPLNFFRVPNLTAANPSCTPRS
jgi:hypothetical protein